MLRAWISLNRCHLGDQNSFSMCCSPFPLPPNDANCLFFMSCMVSFRVETLETNAYPVVLPLMSNLGKNFEVKIWKYDQVGYQRFEKQSLRPVSRAFWDPCRKNHLFLVIRKGVKESSPRLETRVHPVVTWDCEVDFRRQLYLPHVCTQRVCAKVCKAFTFIF